VPYPGFPDLASALLGGQVEVASSDLSSALRQRQAGANLRILALFGPERNPLAPDVPTAREQGVDIELGVMLGLLAPPKVPPPVAQNLVEGFHRAASHLGPLRS
jgi:tripartite-type tricarboxylate transporter receptor subunit TctC